MEVHHHSHAHGKKNWKSYFWEFLMLFLAVFCGFLAEYQLEHKIERDRAKDFAITLYAEIKRDTTELNEIRNRTEIAFHSLDTLIPFLTKASLYDNSGLIYYHCGLGMYSYFFTANEATLQQMKGAGAIRYFHNYNLISAISEYEYNIRFLYQLETNLYMNFMEARKVQMKLFDNRYIYFAQAWDSTYDVYKNLLVQLKTSHVPLISYQPELVSEFRNWAQNRIELNRFKVKQYNRFIASAGKLLQILKEEYHLE